MRGLCFTLVPVIALSSAGVLRAQETSGPRPATCDANLEHYASEPDAKKRAGKMLDMAKICWLDYDAYEDRNNIGTPAGPPPRRPSYDRAVSGIARIAPLETFPIEQRMLIAAAALRDQYAPLPFDVAGETDYLRARTLAREAYRLDPANPRAFRLLSQLAVVRANWAELEELALGYIQRAPRDAWARMTHALAVYRRRPDKDAAAKFDSALAMMDAKERKRLDNFERVLRPREAAAFAKLDSAARANTIRTSWLLAEPLWSSKQADPRAEFLARITYAELRWTVDDEHRGADSDRGDVYIRYGPPNQVWSAVTPVSQVGALYWIYNAGIAFAFEKQLHYGTARFVRNDVDQEIIDRMKNWIPARWDNIATSRIDSMPTQVARFRSGPDSVEVLLATRAPVEAMQLVGLDNVQPRANLWLYGLDTPAAFVDSVPVGASGRLQWTRRVGAGSYYYRVESTIPNTAVAGRAAARMQMGGDTTTGFSMRGFGLSDVLLATKINSTGAARRWIDFDAEPLLGAVKKGSEITLVWENYELGQRDQAARYEVLLTIERGQSAVGKIAAQIVSRVASMIGVDASDDKLAMKFERTVPYAAVIADNITISLGDTPDGVYVMTLRITDRLTGRVASRVMNLHIAR